MTDEQRRDIICSYAEALYDDGWRAEDRERMLTELNIPAEEANAICDKLREIVETERNVDEFLHYYAHEARKKPSKAELQYQREMASIEWAIAKDPTLEVNRKAWEAEAKKRKDNRIAEINKPKLTPEQRAMIEHNLEIIEDNIGYGLKDFLRGVRTEQEVIAYEREAKAELRRFKRHLLNGGKAVYNDESQIWEIPQEEHK